MAGRAGRAEAVLYEFNVRMLEGINNSKPWEKRFMPQKSHCSIHCRFNHYYDYLNLFNYNLYGDPAMRRSGVTPPPSPTPLCNVMAASIVMPSEYFRPNDPCECAVTVCNPGPDTLESAPVFVVLDVHGEIFCAPGFSGFDYYMVDLLPGETVIPVFDAFAWPEGAGYADGLIWYAAVTDPAVSNDLGRCRQLYIRVWGVKD